MTNSIVSTHVLVSDYLSLSFLILVLFQELDMEVTKPKIRYQRIIQISINSFHK